MSLLFPTEAVDRPNYETCPFLSFPTRKSKLGIGAQALAYGLGVASEWVLQRLSYIAD
jgi:hypothetical protein